MSSAVKSVSSEMEGIRSILVPSKYQISKPAASLQRTLSADMCAKNLLAKSSVCLTKNISSSKEFQTMLQEEKMKKDEEPAAPSDLWSSMVMQKSPLIQKETYVHLLAKQSKLLSQQSLDICTEGLGSETGSDEFSFIPSSETSDEESVEKETAVLNKKKTGVVNCYAYTSKKSPPHSFPPPLPSLSNTCLQVRSHRVDGRLVLEAVPVRACSSNYFQTQREGGRLLLTVSNTNSVEPINTKRSKGGVKENGNPTTTTPLKVCTLPPNPSPINMFLLKKNLIDHQEEQELAAMWDNMPDYLLPFFKSCKDSRMPILDQEPYLQGF